MRSASYHVAAILLWAAFSIVTNSALAVTLAADDASQAAYSDGWQAGDNGGVGFGPWQLDYSGLIPGLFHDPQFIDQMPLSGNTLGAPAFGLTTSARELLKDTSEARRQFTMPLGIGQTFSLDVDGSFLEPTTAAFGGGNTIQLFGNDGQERFGIYTSNRFLGDKWIATGDVNTMIPAETAFHIDFSLATADTYDLVLSPIGGGQPLFMQTGSALTGAAGAGITSLRISNYGTGSSLAGVNELFFDNLMVTAAGLNGDYSHNGAVDAADYIIWRKTLGIVGDGLPADGNGNNQVDLEDYNVWRTNFDQTADGATADAAAVAEPATGLTAGMALASFLIASIIKRANWRRNIHSLKLVL
jgi:hypothetical protein